VDTLMDQLVDNLEEQLATYKLLIKYGQEKQDILVDGRLAELESLVKKEQQVVYRNGELEQSRRQLVSAISRELAEGEGKADLTLTDILSHLDGQDKARLETLFQELERVVLELGDLNTKNNALIEQSLSYINYSLDVLAGADLDSGAYSRKAGQKEVPKDSGKAKKDGKSFLDHRV